MRAIKILCLFSFLSISGCAQTPKYEQVDTTAYLGDRYSQLDSDEILAELDSTLWWTQFNDPVIDALVANAIQNNLDIKIAAANVLESEALVRASTGNRWPQINATTSGERSFTGSSTGSSFNAGSDRVYTTTYQVGASVAWQADLFGKLRSAQKASIADWQASQTDYQALIYTIISNVIRQRVQLAIAIQRLNVATSILDSRENTLEIVNRRYRRGVSNSSAVDVRLARENVYSAEANIFALEQNIITAKHALDVLTGDKPKSSTLNKNELKALPVLDAAIAGIPAQLLDRRPDLRAAEYRLIAANERVGVAIADMYPDLTISLSGGWRDSELSDLFSSQSLFASLLGELTQSIFAGGSLRAETDAAKARLEVQANTYANEVLQAIREVEDALVKNSKLSQRLSKVNLQVEEARFAEKLSRSRYSRGVESLLTVLETERRRQAAEDTLLQVEENYWNARIDLYLSIGGDWIESDQLNLASGKK